MQFERKDLAIRIHESAEDYPEQILMVMERKGDAVPDQGLIQFQYAENLQKNQRGNGCGSNIKADLADKMLHLSPNDQDHVQGQEKHQHIGNGSGEPKFFIRYCSVFGFIPAFAMLLQYVWRHTCGVMFGMARSALSGAPSI